MERQSSIDNLLIDENNADDQNSPLREVPDSNCSSNSLILSIWVVVFWIFGVAMLSPCTWIQLTSYFHQRLKGSPFAGNFETYFTVTYQVANILFLCILLSFPGRLTISFRIIVGLLLAIGLFIIAAVMPYYRELDPTAYFYITLLLIAGSSLSQALLSAMIGLATSYPSLCMTSIVSGQGIAGLIPSIALMFQAPDPHGDYSSFKIMIYFAMGILINAISLFGFGILKISYFSPKKEEYEIVHDQDLIIPDAESIGIEDDCNSINETDANVDVWNIIKIPFVSVLLTYGITLSIFPAFSSNVAPQQPFPNFVSWHFIAYNIGDWLGKTSTALPLFSQLTPKTLFTLSLCRLIYLPLFLLCNVLLFDENGIPYKNILPTIFSDGMFFVLILSMSFTNGWLATTSFIQGSELTIKKVGNQRKTLAVVGDLMVLGLTFGLAFGSINSFLLQAISCTCNPM
ncbi:nucleoside transporter-domain-containing protein [Globomyces pollinis-pini]|nr:nucleoside transporter-domain-containing protein [Globomyces pollinis-pini]